MVRFLDSNAKASTSAWVQILLELSGIVFSDLQKVQALHSDLQKVQALHFLLPLLTWREKSMYGKKYMGTSRSTFVIGSDGILKWVGYGVRAKGHVEKIMNELSIE